MSSTGGWGINLEAAFFLFYAAWTVGKLAFYVIPISNLIAISPYRNSMIDRVIVWLLLIPFVEFIIYFFILTHIIDKIAESTGQEDFGSKCQTYGIAAGTINLIVISYLFEFYKIYVQPASSMPDIYQLFMLYATSAFWLLLSYMHLKHFYIMRATYLRDRVHHTRKPKHHGGHRTH